MLWQMIMVTLAPAVQVMRITNRLFTVTLGVLMAAVVGVDLRSGIMATTMMVIIPVVEFCLVCDSGGVKKPFPIEDAPKIQPISRQNK